MKICDRRIACTSLAVSVFLLASCTASPVVDLHDLHSTDGADLRPDLPGNGGADAVLWPDALPGGDSAAGETWDLASEMAGDAGGPEPGEFGWPCDSPADCFSGYCISRGNGSVCSMQCVEDCPEGWTCAQDLNAAPDIVFVCVPGLLTLCAPCTTDEQCGLQGFASGSRCVDMGAAGAFCGAKCNGECEGGYVCQNVTTVAGDKAQQCVPPAYGECDCSPWAVAQGAVTTCSVTSDAGTCWGQRSCLEDGSLSTCDAAVPAVEICDGADDDCDGEIDEELGDTVCGLGICEHVQTNCVDGQPAPCDPQQGAVAEECNGLDDDCDGTTDESFMDCDGDGLPVCIDDDDDADGVLDDQDNCICAPNPGQEDFDLDNWGDYCDPDDDNDLSADTEDCAPFDPQVHPGAAETCNGLDDNCNDEVDDGLGQSTCGQGNCQHTVDNCVAAQVQFCDPFAGALPEECNGEDDDCDGDTDDFFPDLDQDGEADCVDDDDDGDQVDDDQDNCPQTANSDQSDVDDDGYGDVCDFGCFIDPVQEWEADCDGIPDALDNCPLMPNPDQLDSDGDGAGDQCDGDDDNDGVPDGADNCPFVINPNQSDLDQDGHGDLCDGDVDGDGIPDDDDNCQSVKNSGQEDFDQDGAGDACDSDDDGDGDPDLIDCAPFDAAIHHQAQEVCNGLNDDCDESTDEQGADGCLIYYLDIDEDGYGVAGKNKCLCEAQDLYGALEAGDCEPLEPAINPGQPEVCNGLDDNCDEVADEGFPNLDGDSLADCVDPDDDGDGALDENDNCPQDPNGGQEDLDGDGQGDVCDDDADGDGAPNELDCQPLDADVHPAALEVCDGIDNDCDVGVDEDLGTTTCGLGECLHTVDNCAGGLWHVCDPEAGAGPEVCDGKDNDCDGAVDNGFELDLPCTAGLGECEDEGITVCADDGTQTVCAAEPGQAQTELCDGKDNDCNGVVDNTFDLGAPCTAGVGECAASGATVCSANGIEVVCDAMPLNPGVEVCNSLDDDCDGEVDEELGNQTCGQGQCEHEAQACLGGQVPACDPLEGQQDEVCDGLDNDCDGAVDEDLGTTTCGLGECEHVEDNCDEGIAQNCDPLKGQLPESCNNLDDDCDGVVDDGLGMTTCGLGPCEHEVANCAGGQEQSCDPMQGAVDETCDGVDNDCDGDPDDGLSQACQNNCGSGTETCSNGTWVNCTAPQPAPETCDGQDNDCDGVADEGWTYKCQSLSCSGNGLIHTISDGCIDDGGGSAGGDALQVFCCYGIARFCLSGESCPWRNGCVQTNATCSHAGLGSDYMANAWCSYWNGYANYYCKSNGQVYF